MKILSITIHHVVNFGSVLQAYATQKLFELKNVDFITLDYRPIRLSRSYRFKEIFFLGKRPFYKRLSEYLTMEILNRRVFDKFLKKNIKLTEPFYEYDKGRVHFYADIYMTGSDQVWNSVHNKIVDTTFYWDFVKGKKVSFASSFGRVKLPNDEINIINGYLSCYSFLSAREDTGVNILKSLQCDKHVEQIIDPTLLLSGDEWRAIAKYKKKELYSKYVLIYPMSDVDPLLIKLARLVADKNNAEVWLLSPGLKTYKSCDRTLKLQSPERFLALMDKAVCIITNSFHGTAFAINFNRPFISVAPKRFSTRIESILKLFKLDKQLYSETMDLSKVLSINYTSVNNILLQERKKADCFINEIISI